jgi:DNA-binding response OmpR family regulator
MQYYWIITGKEGWPGMKGKILVIEDDLDTAHVLEMLFKAGGYSVKISDNGEKGITEAVSNHPDLVVLDVMMPGIDGYDTCSRLKQQMDIPILILTARYSPTEVVKGFNAGADDFVKKPYNTNELLLRVKALVNRYHSANSYAAAVNR